MSSPLPETPEAAEAQARQIIRNVLGLLEAVTAPTDRRAQHLAEQLSFLQARDNFRAFYLLLEQGEDVPAATLARALFEEAMRWSWVDEEPAERTAAFLGEAGRAHRLISEAAVEQDIDAGMFFGPLVNAECLDRRRPGLDGPRRRADDDALPAPQEPLRRRQAPR